MDTADVEVALEFGAIYVWCKKCGREVVGYRRDQSVNLSEIITTVEAFDHKH